MATNSNMAFFVAVAALALVMNSVGAATTHQVGDGLGWIIPPAGAYVTWASNKTFTVGDVLVFAFSNGNHDVAEVTKAAYDSCSATNPISLAVSSPASLTLNTSGEHYYICTFSGHCAAGQKLSINVTGTSSPAPAPSTSSPPPSPSPSPPAAVPAPAPSTGSPPSPSPSPSPPAAVPAPAPSTSSPPSPSPRAPVPAPAPSTSSPPPPPGAVPAPAPSTSNTPPSPTPPSSPTPQSAASPPPTPPSAATSLRVAGLSATFLSIALALLF